MIAGMSGSLLSHDAVEALVQEEGRSDIVLPARHGDARLRGWHASVRARLGPTAGARTVFDEVGEPLMRAMGFDLSAVRATSEAVEAVLFASGAAVAVFIVPPWGKPLRSLWATAVRAALARDVRWAICANGPAVCLFDASRAYARRALEFDLELALDLESSRTVLCGLFDAASLGGSDGAATLDRIIEFCERHRGAVRGSLRTSVHDAVLQLSSAFRVASGSAVPDERLLDESLVVIYRVLFLLFAEARGLVPGWHPVYRDSYTIESLVCQLETGAVPPGVWETFQAISRLAHRGCTAGTLRVPPFNGRLFSPLHAPLAASVSLSDAVVRGALLSLTTTTGPRGRRRISYSDLGVEQLGGVYEHLLEFDVNTEKTPQFVATGRRKATGSFYTPRALTEFVVRRGLAPAVHDKTPEEILALRVLDPAMGSGAFLVAACRYLATAYEEALIREGTLTASDISERERADFRRAVAQRCLYGVDLNPMAVQLARLSLWLATLAADKPLSFLDHRLRVGQSLIGASIDDVLRQPHPGRVIKTHDLPLFAGEEFTSSLESAVGRRASLAELPDDSLEQVRSKERELSLINGDEGPLKRWKDAADVWCAAWLEPGVAGDRQTFRAMLDYVLGRSRSLPAHLFEAPFERASTIASTARVFNWTLEFPEIFYEPNGAPRSAPGFDAILGNPPWDVLRDDAGGTRGLHNYARGSGQYRLQGRGHPNLYQLFFERGIRLLRDGGRCALVLPSGFATDQGCGSLRRHLFERTRVDTFTVLDNKSAIFPIHRSLKFVLLSFSSGGSSDEVPLRCGVRTVDTLERLPDLDEDPAALMVPRHLLARLSGDGLEVPELKSELDLQILSRVIAHVPPCADAGGWNIHFGRELNATDDRPHFVEEGGLPVIEGKQLRPFGTDAAPSRFRIPARVARRILDPVRTFDRPRLAYRDVASATNRVTLIAAIIPRGAVTTHTVFCLKEDLDEDSQQFLCGVLNSFVANYLARMRVSSHVTTAIIGRLPVPKPHTGDPAFAAVVDLARKLTRRWDPSLFAALNAWAAWLYGLSGREFAHVADTFPLIAKAERAAAIEHFSELCARRGGQSG